MLFLSWKSLSTSDLDPSWWWNWSRVWSWHGWKLIFMKQEIYSCCHTKSDTLFENSRIFYSCFLLSNKTWIAPRRAQLRRALATELHWAVSDWSWDKISYCNPVLGMYVYGRGENNVHRRAHVKISKVIWTRERRDRKTYSTRLKMRRLDLIIITGDEKIMK